jgi:FeS assembly SUF system regulator
MIRMTRQADYGIVILTWFAHSAPDVPHNARDVAAEVRLPQPMVTKILKALARGGLLASQRGVKGGYRLARSAEQITVADIISALEGPIQMTDCTGLEPGSCDIEPSCPVRTNWRKINHVLRQALDTITLSEMSGPLPLGVLSRVAGGAGTGTNLPRIRTIARRP